jgi:hypothetical protein
MSPAEATQPWRHWKAGCTTGITYEGANSGAQKRVRRNKKRKQGKRRLLLPMPTPPTEKRDLLQRLPLVKTWMMK